MGLRRFKTNFVFPEDGRFISSKFDIDPCIHREDPLDQKNADWRTAFQLYIVDLNEVLYRLQLSKLLLTCKPGTLISLSLVANQLVIISLSLGHLLIHVIVTFKKVAK